MKKRSNLLIVLLCIVVVLLFGLGFTVYESTKITTKNMELVSAKADTVRDSVIQAQDEADRSAAEASAAKENSAKEASAKTDGSADEAAEEAETENDHNAALMLEDLAGEDMSELALTDPLPKHHVIFVGDSRTVGMGRAEADRFDTCIYIGESGEGLSWFMETGYERMAKVIRSCPNDPVVMNLGVNDLSEISHYLDLYATFKDDFPETEFYFMSVNPVTIENENVSNEEITEFNARLKETYGDHFLDVNALMTKDGFEDVDGIHYSEKTYCDIHDYVVRALYPDNN